MPKWKKDARSFTVGVNYQQTRGYQSSIPKPIIDALEIHPDKSRNPDQITYVIKGKHVEIRGEMTPVNRPKKDED